MARFSVALWPFFTASILFLVTLASVSAQVTLPVPHSRIVQAVDDSHLTRLSGNMHPLARPEFDRGSLDDAAPLHRMVLVLKRGADQETALKHLIDQQQDKSSSNYLQWLTPESFGTAFGPSDRDLSLLTAWLSSHGFAGIQLSAGRTFLEFSPITVVYSGNVNYAGSVSNSGILTQAAGFTVSSSTGALTAAQETVSGTVIFTATPIGGFHSTVSFACTDGLPAGATCFFNPPTLALAGTAAATTILSITLAAPGGETLNAQAPSQRTRSRFTAGSGVTLAGLILLFLPRRNRHRKSRCTLVAVAFVASALGFITGCGSGVSFTNGAGSANTVGIYSVTVTAAAGSTKQATTITLTLQ